MPHKQGSDTHRGGLSPATGLMGTCVNRMVREVYGACRSANPNEDPDVKAMCAKIAWHTAKQKCR